MTTRTARLPSRLPYICATYGARAQKDLGYTRNKVAGLFGNGDVEADGYNVLDEEHPTVAGSKGGLGWMQWTGEGKSGRRKAYEAWCSALGLDPYADESNYRYMVHELLTIETAAHRAILACADDPAVAATVVCTKYLRPGTPHLDARIASAHRAAQYLAAPAALAQAATPRAAPVAPAPSDTSSDAPAVQVEAGRWPEDELSAFEIKAIQQRLLDLGFHIVGFADGKWGKRTSAALTALQQQAANGGARVSIDGHYGPQTRGLLANDAMHATVPPERAAITSKILAKLGNPAVKAGQKITLASVGSVLAGAGALAGTLSSGWTSELPWPFSMVAAFLPPWAMIALVVAFNVYNALKATGLIGSAVARVQQGIDNTGAPAPDAPTFQFPPLPFGLDKLLTRS